MPLVHAALVLVSVLFGCNFVFTKVVVGAIGVDAWLFYRLAGASLILVPLALALPRRPVPRRAWPGLALACLLGIVLNQVLFTEGLSRTTPAHSSVINSLIPVLTLVLAVLVGQERCTRGKVAALAVCLLGIGVLFEVDEWAAPGHSFGATATGDLLTLGNATAFSTFLVLMRRLSRSIDPLLAAAAFVTGGMLFFLFWSWPAIGAESFAGLLAPDVWPAALVVILGSTVTTYLLNNWALRHTHSSSVALYIVLQPVVATSLSVALGMRAPEPRFYLAGLLVVSGLVLRQWRRRGPGSR